MNEIKLAENPIGATLVNVLSAQLSERLATVTNSIPLSDLMIFKRAGIDSKTVKKLRTKTGLPSAESLVKLLAFCENLSAEWLFTGRGDMIYEPKDQESEGGDINLEFSGIDKELVKRLIEENKRLSELNTMLVNKLAGIVQ